LIYFYLLVLVAFNCYHCISVSYDWYNILCRKYIYWKLWSTR